MSKFKFLPKTLFGRFSLIIVLPIIILQIVTIYVFLHRHWANVSIVMSDSLMREVNLIIDNYENNHEIAKKNIKNLICKLLFFPKKV